MTLSTFQTELDKLGFETVTSKNLLQGARERGNSAIEISIDSGGGAKVVLKRKIESLEKPWKLNKKVVPIVCEFLEIKTFRVQLASLADLKSIAKKFFEE